MPGSDCRAKYLSQSRIGVPWYILVVNADPSSSQVSAESASFARAKNCCIAGRVNMSCAADLYLLGRVLVELLLCPDEDNYSKKAYRRAPKPDTPYA